MSDVFRVGIETTSGVTYSVDNIPADQASDVMARYIAQDGDGVRFLTDSGAAHWAWNQIHAIRLVRGSYTVEQYP